ncbi:hypothetical protein [Candidatus Stoquefichus massiliensis]|uniref:hypothetical protein n=1 Tax=Candidatus Stoquefichus massiliensis TaxID=1470350 RepID=UPI0004875A19|nr:hypothetical protein [Candidatus Stoquefichus massiliensis]
MKTKKKMVALGMSLLVLCGVISTVSASVYVSGTQYQTVTHKDIPAWAGEHYDTYYGSKKATTGDFATFKKTHGDAALGNFAELVSSSKASKSRFVGIPLNSAQLATEYGCSKGSIYYSGVTSHDFEPSNSCDVTMKFSADNLK